MQIEWTPGPPPDGDGEWIVEVVGGEVFRTVWDERLSVHRAFISVVVPECIIRHMPYISMPKPLKPFRLFKVTHPDGRSGVGCYDPYAPLNKYTVRWCDKGPLFFYSSYQINDFQIEWIDDEA